MIWFLTKGYTWATVTEPRQVQRHSLRGHANDVYDLSWAPDSRRLVTGSVDNTAIVWDVPRSRGVAVLEGHTQFVQGVAWDPTGKYIVTQSSDRTARVYKAEPDVLVVPHTKAGSKRGRRVEKGKPYQCVQVIKTREIGGPASEGGPSSVAASSSGGGSGVGVGSAPAPPPPAKHHMFMDETSVMSFFRRPAFTPDGSLLITPAGAVREEAPRPHATGGAPSGPKLSEGSSSKPTTWLFHRDSLEEATARPVAHMPVCTAYRPASKLSGGLPSPALTPASALVRCSPVLYTLRRKAGSAEQARDNGAYILPYR